MTRAGHSSHNGDPSIPGHPMSDSVQGEINDTWFEHRLALHSRYEELAGLKDASRLGYMHGGQVRWTEDQVVELWQKAANAADRRKDAINHVYVHVPFCKSLCSFCNYERLRPSNAVEIQRYTERVLRSIQRIGEVVEPLTWHTLYFGGGTPSVLPVPQLAKILEALDGALTWHAQSTRFFEFDPMVMTADRIDLLVKHGFRDFSFGVQTLQPSINAAHNRGKQGPDIVARRFDELRERNVFNISCDLLLGLKGTTPEMMAEEAGEILALRPRWLDLFYLVPTREYVESHWGGDKEAFWAHVRQFHDRIPALIKPVAHKHGFRVNRGHGHNIILFRQMEQHEFPTDHHNSIFSYTQLVDQQRRPLHLMGLGTSARSLIFGQAQLHCRHPQEIGDAANQHNYFGAEVGMEGEVRLFLAHHLRDRHNVDRAMFLRIFDMDITEAIPTAIAAWQRLGLVTITEEELRLEPQERRERARTLMWVVPDHRLEHEVSRHEKNLMAQRRKSKGPDKRTSPAT